jgi:hypothetical protein
MRLVTPTPAHIAAAQAFCDWPDCDHTGCAPTDVTPLTPYALEVTRCHDTRDGVSWEARLYRHGVHVCDVVNDGHGGSNIYLPPQPGDYEQFHPAKEAFATAARQAFPALTIESDDAAIDFLDFVAHAVLIPGVTA